MTIKKQTKTYGPRFFKQGGERYRITAEARHDDSCGNGHNSFAITGEIDRQAKNGRWIEDMGGSIHAEIAKHFPELAPFIKWHLSSTDGPMHYIANTVYHASDCDHWGSPKGKEPDLGAARRCAVWPNATLDQLADKDTLAARLPSLLADFRADVESLGFTYS
jgi:hypothetical protein